MTENLTAPSRELELPSSVQELRARLMAPLLTWHEDDPDPAKPSTPYPGGDIGGSHQLGDVWSRAWIAHLPNGLFARIEHSFYVGEAKYRRRHDFPAEEDRSIWQQTEWLIFRDRKNPGGSEVNSFYTYDEDADEPGGLRAIDANAQHLCAQLRTRDISWPTDDDQLRLLTEGLPPVTEYGQAPRTHLFIGVVPIGTLTEFSVDPHGQSPRYFIQRHDWENGRAAPSWSVPGVPGEDYDPLDMGTFTDPAEAVRLIVTDVPPMLSIHVYGLPTEEEWST